MAPRGGRQITKSTEWSTCTWRHFERQGPTKAVASVLLPASALQGGSPARSVAWLVSHSSPAGGGGERGNKGGGGQWKSHSWFLAGVKDIAIEMKKCIQPGLCKETITYMGFPIANGSQYCRSAIRNGAWGRSPTPIFFVFFLEKLLY